MTWDPRLYFPSEGRRAEDFFAPKNPDSFGRVWTRELGYLKAAHYPQTTEAAFMYCYLDVYDVMCTAFLLLTVWFLF